MSAAQNLARLFPTSVRVALKKYCPTLIETLAIAFDSASLTMRKRAGRRAPNNKQAHRLFEQLRAGFSHNAEELESLKLAAPHQPKAAASAAWYLARWQVQNGDYGKALGNIMLATAANPKLCTHFHVQILTVECLLQLGRPGDAKQWLKWASKWRPFQFNTDLDLTAANISYAIASSTGDPMAADSERLALLNRAYTKAGFSKIEKIDGSAPLSLDNITVSHPRPVDAPAKLSVLVPAYNCARTLPIALTSILNQTWHNLEVIVVDDRGPDETWRVIQEFAQRDSRIVPVRHEVNGGAYSARNTALAHATGEFVTVHDADDWSHPEKLAAQMQHAMSNPYGISTTTGVRVSYDLRFRPSTGAAAMLMQNLSSLLLRREMLIELGGWDRTRVAADSELYERIKAKHNLKTNVLFQSTPLTLILLEQTSLTQTSTTGLATLYYGARRQYKEAYRFWHASERARQEPDFRMTDTRRFPAPRIVLGRKEPITDIDVVIIDDYANTVPSFEGDKALWNALAEAGRRVGIVHWPTFKTATANVALPIRAAIAAGLVENIVPGETVRCKSVVVMKAELLDEPPSPLPSISSAGVYVVSGHELQPEQIAEAERCLGGSPRIVGTDDLKLVLDL
ncbi:glycosyltransferase family 2 protein [Microvirga sp. TS319]|uniref:glycosyltransferase family 2 protein n=1 Tax=Microvirga sp. TS319 TaxID=3241165 RepID=UPI00351AA02C